MTINPGRTSRYSDDLRLRMIWQREALGLKLEIVANNLGVDPSAVSRVVRIFQDTGDVQKRPKQKADKPCSTHDFAHSAPEA